MRNTVALVLLSVSIVFAAACHHGEAEHATIELKPVNAHVEEAGYVALERPVLVYGMVQPSKQSFVSSRVMGPVVEVHVEAGDVVKKGAPLITIEPETAEGTVAQAEGALAQAKAALALAEKNLKRFENLHKKGAASDLELDMARMQYEQAKGAVEQAEGALKAASSVADEAVVRAPFDARVVERLVEVGDMAAPGRPLVRVESLKGREVWLVVREADIHRISVGDEVPVTFDSLPDLGEVMGKVSEIVPAADPATHTFTVKLKLKGTDVPSGVAVKAKLPGDTQRVITVPESAVHRRGGLELVVVVGPNGKAKTKAVTTGRKLEKGRIEILSGLEEGERVLVDAPGPVADGTPVEVLS